MDQKAGRPSSLDEIWADDVLGRRVDAEFLIRFLLGHIAERGESGVPQSYVLNLDAAWGHGKTFFLQRLQRSLQTAGYWVALINAWQDDHAADPLVAVMSAVDEVFAPGLGARGTATKKLKQLKGTAAAVVIAGAKGAAKHWIRKGIGGEGWDNVLETLDVEKGGGATATVDGIANELGGMIDQRAKQLLDGFREGQRSIKTFRTQLGEFLAAVSTKQGKLPLFILVDELDRCRPPYAIALLERVKHLFDIDNVVFVVATDSGQLRHAINAVYGAGFDSQRYLLRFFDRTYVFEAPKFAPYLELLLRKIDSKALSLPPSESASTFISAAFEMFDLSLRDAEQCIDILRSIVTTWNVDTRIELAVLLPLVIAHQRGLEARLDDRFIAEMKILFVNPTAWVVKFPGAREFNVGAGAQEERDVSVLGFDLFSAFVRALNHSMPKQLENNPRTQPERWVNSRIFEEYADLHQARHDHKKPPPSSVILQYPLMVRSAGRLIPAVQ